MTNQELHDLTRRIGVELCAQTKQDWGYVVPDELSHWATIRQGVGEDTPAISINASRNGDKGKLVITCTFPRGDKGAWYAPRERPSIGVSATKPVDAIARDIARRLLPDYLKAHAEGLGQKHRDMDARARGQIVALHLAIVLGEKLGDTDNGWTLHRYGTPSVRVEVDRYSDDRRVKITLDDLTQEEAQAVLCAIRPAPVAREEEGRP